MEDIGLLNCDNESNMYALHYVNIPRINRHLKEWNSAWINHPLSSSHNFTPNQLWTSGLQQLAIVNSSIAREFHTEVLSFKIHVMLYVFRIIYKNMGLDLYFMKNVTRMLVIQSVQLHLQTTLKLYLHDYYYCSEDKLKLLNNHQSPTNLHLN